MPAIEKIYLCTLHCYSGQNYITNLRPLRKLCAPNLVFLSLSTLWFIKAAYESMETVDFTFLES